MTDSFLVIFSNISEQLFQGFLFHGTNRRKVFEKRLSKLWEISEEIVRWGIFFNFSVENHSTTDDFLRILWNVLEQLFQRTLQDGCFWEYLGLSQ